MASINEKLNYINETKSLIKDKLNDLGSEIEDETTFREYVEKIEDLYDEWPKINDEDTNITLNNTKKGKIRITLKGNNSQFTTTGKNKINLNDFSPVSSATTITTLETGIHIKNINGGYGAKIVIQNLETNTNYYISYIFERITTGSNRVVVFAGTGQSTSLISLNNKDGGVFNTGDNTSVNIWFYANTPGDGEVEYTNIQLEKNNEATTYEPYTYGPSPNFKYPQDIILVNGNHTITIEDDLNSENYSINLPNNMELCKIGSYEDYIYKDNDKWYKYGAIDKVILDGSEEWQERINMGNNRQFYAPTNAKNIVAQSSSGIQQMCNYAKYSYATFNYGGKYTFALLSNTKVLYVTVDENITLENWKTTLSNKNLIVYYQKTSPIITQITDTTLIEQLNILEKAYSYDNKTIISQTNNNLPFIINASALLKNSN